MSKHDNILESNESIEFSDDSSHDEEIIYISPEEFKFNQLDENFQVRSDLFDFLKNYIDSKEYIFPIMENFNFNNFCSFMDKFIVPLKLE